MFVLVFFANYTFLLSNMVTFTFDALENNCMKTDKENLRHL